MHCDVDIDQIRTLCGTKHIVQGYVTTICPGDLYVHEKLGIGMIIWINTDVNSKYPIKMFFKKEGAYAFFDINGKQYEEQKAACIEFPKLKIAWRVCDPIKNEVEMKKIKDLVLDAQKKAEVEKEQQAIEILTSMVNTVEEAKKILADLEEELEKAGDMSINSFLAYYR